LGERHHQQYARFDAAQIAGGNRSAVCHAFQRSRIASTDGAAPRGAAN
jgi:hypothetical protein